MLSKRVWMPVACGAVGSVERAISAASPFDLL